MTFQRTPFATILLLVFVVFLHAPLIAQQIINDVKLIKNFETKMETFVKDESITRLADLIAPLKKLPANIDTSTHKLSTTSPKNPLDSIFILASVFDCGHCERWHLGSISTAWALTKDGLMATSYHVFDNKKGEIFGMSDRHGNVWPIIKLIAANEAADICIFKVKGKDFKPLAVGRTAKIGSNIHVIGHPNRRFYFQSFGKVNRYFHAKRPKTLASSDWMSVSADFARGSSGGPILNSKREVVGMVSNTAFIHYDSKTNRSGFQMVIKNCTPASEIQKATGKNFK